MCKDVTVRHTLVNNHTRDGKVISKRTRKEIHGGHGSQQSTDEHVDATKANQKLTDLAWISPWLAGVSPPEEE